MGKRGKEIRKRKRSQAEQFGGNALIQKKKNHGVFGDGNGIGEDADSSSSPSTAESIDNDTRSLCSFLSRLDPLKDTSVFYSEPLKRFRRVLRPLLSALLENRIPLNKKERKKQRLLATGRQREDDDDFCWTTEESWDALKTILLSSSGGGNNNNSNDNKNHNDDDERTTTTNNTNERRLIQLHEQTIERILQTQQQQKQQPSSSQKKNHQPPFLQGKRFKHLRTVLHPFCVELDNERHSVLSYQISCAFRDGRQRDALGLLRRAQAQTHPPKLGNLQRWVRDCMNENDFAGLNSPVAVELLDAIVRLQPNEWTWKKKTATTTTTTTTTTDEDEEEEKKSNEEPADIIEKNKEPNKGMVCWREPFAPVPRRYPVPTDPAQIKYLSLPSACSDDNAASSHRCYTGCRGTLAREASVEAFIEEKKIDPDTDYRRIYHEKGVDRRPRNRHDLEIYTGPDHALEFFDGDGHKAAVRYDVKDVPGAVFVSGVFSPAECNQIIALAEAKGFVPDEPLTSAPPPPGFAPRASNFVLLSQKITSKLFERTKPHLSPEEGPGGQNKLTGINERLRLYRYQPGAIYRPHMDGSWPGSGIHDGRYVYDYFGDSWSKHTMVVYLNDDFSGGGTVFYTPSGVVGRLNAHTVEPRQGGVLVFPHGAADSLVHEGGYCERGVKYIIRTDVLYGLPTHTRKAW